MIAKFIHRRVKDIRFVACDLPLLSNGVVLGLEEATGGVEMAASDVRALDEI